MQRSLQNAVIPDYDTVEDTGHAVTLAGYRTTSSATNPAMAQKPPSDRVAKDRIASIDRMLEQDKAYEIVRKRIAEEKTNKGGAAGH